MIHLHTTYIHPDAYQKVQETLTSTFLSEGKIVQDFEAMLSQKLGIVNPVALNSGTSALHLALDLAGIGPGDEVILPAQTFVASALVILQQKAKPVFADVDYLTGNIDPKSILQKITPSTKAIMPVHWAGMPCDMDEIMDIARVHNLVVIEDAAHALGATYKGKAIGSISPYTCFSFQAIKHVTTGDGGAVACNDVEKMHEAVTKRWFGIDRRHAQPSILGERQYNIESLGYKYHLNNYGAALGLANLVDFENRLSHLRSIASLYRTELGNIAGLELFDAPMDRQSAYWLFGMHVERREEFITAMKERGIVTGVVHQRIDRNSVFGGVDDSLVQQAKFDSTQIHIPLHCSIDIETAYYIVNAIKKGW